MEGHGGRSIVQKRAEQACRIEELPRAVESQRGRVVVEVYQGRGHGRENAGEKYGDLGDGAPAELVLTAIFLLRRQQGQDNYGHECIFPQESQRHRAVRLAHSRNITLVEEYHRCDYEEDVEQIHRALDSHRPVLAYILFLRGKRFLPIIVFVSEIVQRKQKETGEEPLGQEPEEPCEVSTPEVEQEERRVSQRSKHASAVRHKGDEEEYCMDLVCSLAVDIQQRTYQKHGRARGSDEGGEHETYGQDTEVHARGCNEVAPYQYAAGHDEKGCQQYDERHIVEEQLLKKRLAQSRDHEHDCRGDRNCEGDKGLVAVAFPENRDKKRGQRYHQQHYYERNKHPEMHVYHNIYAKIFRTAKLQNFSTSVNRENLEI